ncbi:MAG: radical SAM protein [Ruminococcaceae bacterium]|nr:radical SAM protein [Oscillospiraceae bacterium]
MKNTHVNIPVFIPHLGCPNMCVFCNQRAISGVCSFIPNKAKSDIEEVLATVRGTGADCEIAFFGGSFTGIDRNLMIELLDLAQSYIERGEVSAIRMSTRPDYIDESVISVLKNYTISAVELGIQSFSDEVLRTSKRGHIASQSADAIRMLKDNGFSVVGQMMIGLPGSSRQDEIYCAQMISSLGADAARIYPTIVFRDTELCEMTKRGEYKPLCIEEAVERSADVLEVFLENNVQCIRIGLCDSENLHSSETYFAGPNHASLGELVHGEIYRRVICDAIIKDPPAERDSLTVFVPRGDISMAVGQKRCNKTKIENKFNLYKIKFIEKDNLTRYNIELQYENKSKSVRRGGDM